MSNHEGIDPEIIQAIYRIVGQVEKRFDALRITDKDAVTLAHDLLSKRLEGYPQLFATKVEMDETARAVIRLEKDALSREIYDQHRAAILDLVAKLETNKLNESVYNTFIENYRIEQQRLIEERRSVAEVLASATEKVRSQFMEERGEYITQEFYDNKHQELVNDVDSLSRWRYMLVGGLVFATFVAPVVTGFVVYTLTH